MSLTTVFSPDMSITIFFSYTCLFLVKIHFQGNGIGPQEGILKDSSVVNTTVSLTLWHCLLGRVTVSEEDSWVRGPSIWRSLLQLCFGSLGHLWSVLFPQLDTEYRKKWDALVIKLEVIERDVVSGSEVLHWVTHFPVSIFTSAFTFIMSVWGRALILTLLFFSIQCTHGIMFMFGGIVWMRKTTWWCWCHGMCGGCCWVPLACPSFMHVWWEFALWVKPGPYASQLECEWAGTGDYLRGLKGYKLFIKLIL